MRKIIPFICIGFIIIAFLIGIIFFINPVTINLIAYLRNYNISSTIGEDDYINIVLFVNDQNSYVLDKKQIVYSNLCSKDEKESVKIDLHSIIKKDETINYNDDTYYMFSLSFKLLIDIEDDYNWYLPEAYLNIGYQGNKDYTIKIGKLSYTKYKTKESKINITSIKPLTFEEDNSYLGGVIYGINNKSNKKINIKKIEILNTNVSVGDGIKEVENIDTIDFYQAAGYDHSLVKEKQNDINIVINGGEEKKIFVPIYYKELFIMNKFPIKITYSLDNKVYEYVFGMYNYYNPIKEVITKNDYTIYKVL